jgi:hypothetical protein
MSKRLTPVERIARLRGWLYKPSNIRIDTSGVLGDARKDPGTSSWPDIAWLLDVAEAALRVDTTFAHVGEPWSPTDHTQALRSLRERLYGPENQPSHDEPEVTHTDG